MASKEADIEITVDKRKYRNTRSTTNSRNNSRTNSPANKKKQDEETWCCHICNVSFSDPNDKLLECQRCKEHFCIKCLKKSEEEYKWMTESDTMWFCIPCREKVERNIIVDREIEEKCREMAANLEDRLKRLEGEVKEKCGKEEVKDIVKEEIEKQKVGDETNTEAKPADVSQVITEMQERKNRENNMVIHGVEESMSESREARRVHDIEKVNEIAEICNTSVEEEDIVRTIRLGKFDKSKATKKRPILVVFRDTKKKVGFFKGGNKLKENSKYEKVRLSNDLTHTEMQNERALFEESREMEKNCPGYRFRVKGPPWARRIVKERATQD